MLCSDGSGRAAKFEDDDAAALAAVRRCCFVGGPGFAALVLTSLSPGDVTLELVAGPASWLSTAGKWRSDAAACFSGQ